MSLPVRNVPHRRKIPWCEGFTAHIQGVCLRQGTHSGERSRRHWLSRGRDRPGPVFSSHFPALSLAPCTSQHCSPCADGIQRPACAAAQQAVVDHCRQVRLRTRGHRPPRAPIWTTTSATTTDGAVVFTAPRQLPFPRRGHLCLTHERPMYRCPMARGRRLSRPFRDGYQAPEIIADTYRASPMRWTCRRRLHQC